MARKILIVWILLFAWQSSLQGQQEPPKERILFVGNSFTFYWNLPKIVELMAQQRQLNWDIDQATLGGASLEQHWKGLRELTTQTTLKNGNYDRVILQDYSSNPLKKPEDTKTYVQAFQKMPLPKTPKWYYYSTWMYPNIDAKEHEHPYPIQHFYEGLQQVIGGQILVVGKVFAQFQKQHPEINLLTDDNKHTSPEGTYLAACVIFSQLSDQSPIGLSGQFYERDEKEKIDTYFIIIQNKTAKILQNFVATYFEFEN